MTAMGDDCFQQGGVCAGAAAAAAGFIWGSSRFRGITLYKCGKWVARLWARSQEVIFIRQGKMR
jgi:hypothetical protein